MSDTEYGIEKGEFDDFSFDDFDMESGGFDVNADRTPIEKIQDDALEGIDDLSTDNALHRKLSDNMLPEGYRAAKEEVLDSAYEVSNMVDRAKRESANSVNAFKKSTNKLLENNKSFLPEAIYNRLHKATLTRESSAATNADEDRIANEIGGFAQTLAEIQGVTAATEAGDKAADREVSKGQHKESMVGIQNVGGKLDRVIAFNERISTSFYQKSLDTQMRTYFAQRDLLEVTKRSNVDIINNLKAIAKNSALPDVIKMRGAEHLNSLMEASVYGKATETAAEFSGNFRKNVMSKIQGRITETQQGLMTALDGAAGGIDMVNQMHESGMAEPFDPAKSAVKMAVGMAGSKAGKAITDKIRETLLNDPNIAMSDAQLKAGMQQLDTFIPYLMEQNKGKNVTLDNILGKAQDFLPKFAGQDQKVAHSYAQRAMDPMPYNLQAHKSLTEIIPELLSLQLHEQRITNGMDPSSPRLVYNAHREAMSTTTSLQGDVLRKVVSKTNVKASKDSLDTAINSLLGPSADNYSVEEKEQLQRQFLKMANEGTHFNMANLTNKNNFADSSNPFALSALAKMEDQFGDVYQRRRAERSMGGISRNSKSALPNIEDALKREVALGNKEALRAAGIIYSDDNGIDKVDNSALTNNLFGNDYFNYDAGKGFDRGYTASPGRAGLGVNQPNSPNVQPVVSGESDSILIKIQKDTANIRDHLRTNVTSTFASSDISTGVVDRLDQSNETLTAILARLNQPFESSGGGMIALSPDDLAKIVPNGTAFENVLGGAFKGAKWAVSGIGSAYSTLFKTGKELTTTGYQGAKTAITDTWGALTDKVTNSDIYIRGMKQVAITKAQLESGQFIDELTGNVIRTVEDITGPVKDADGNYVISPADFAKGLISPSGQSILNRGLNWVTTKPGEWLSSYYGFVFNRVPEIAKTVLGSALDVLIPIVDVYVAGNPRPVLLARVLKSGGYRNQDGSPIHTIDDIDGDVYDLADNVVLTLEEMKDGLVDIEGNPIKSQSIAKLTGDLAGTLTRAGLASIKWAGTKVSNIYKRVFGLGESEGKGLFEGLRGFFSSKVSLMRVTANTVIIEGGALSQGDLNRAPGESAEDYADRLSEVASRVKSKVSSSAASAAASAKEKYEEAKTKGEAFYESVETRVSDMQVDAAAHVDKAKDDIREAIDDPEGLYQQSRDKGQSKIDAMVDSLQVLKDDAVERAKNLKRNRHDADGDGDRDGNFKDRLAGLGKRFNPFGSGSQDTEQKGKDVPEKGEGFLSKLLGGLGGLGEMGGLGTGLMKLLGAGGLMAGLSGMFGGGGEGGGMGGGDGSIMGIDKSTLAMLGGAAFLAPGLTGSLVKGVGKGAWGATKGLGKGAGFLAKNGIKGSWAALRALPAVAGVAGRVGVGALAGLTGALNPIMWGATAAYVGYKGFKFIARRSEVELLESLRFAHYGFVKTEMDKLIQIRFLEDCLTDDIAYDEKGKAYLKRDIKDIIGEFADDFNVNLENETELYNFVYWFLTRFNPAFCKQHEVLNSINTRVDLLDVDDELADHEKIRFAKSIWLVSNDKFQPYALGASPFPNHALITGTDFIKGIEDEVVRTFSEATDKFEARKPATVTEQGTSAKTRFNATGGSTSYTQNNYSAIPSGKPNTAKQAGWMPIGDMQYDTSLLNGTSVDDKPLGQIESLRMHYYGLDTISGHELYCIRALENFVASKVDDDGWFSSQSNPKLDTDAYDCWDKFALLFGWNPKEMEAKRRWVIWFNNRFAIIFLYHQGLLGTLSPGMALGELDVKLDKNKKIEFLSSFTVTTRSKPENVLVSPFPGKMITTDMTKVVIGVSAVRTALLSGKELLNDPIKTLVDKAKAPSKETPHADGSGNPTPKDAVDKALNKTEEKPKGSGILKMSALFRSGSFNSSNTSGGGSTGDGLYAKYKAANGASQAPWTGKGPIDERMKQYGEIIAEMSAKYGVPQDLIRAVIQQESGANANARSNVGAMGLMQLMPGTANDMGVTNAYDPKQNIEGGTKYLATQLRYSDGNIPLALAAYNGGWGYVRDARSKARLALGREPSTQEILDFLPKARWTNKKNNKTYSADYKQMWGYVNKIVPNYAQRSGKSSDAIMGGQPHNATNLKQTSSGVPVPSTTPTNRPAPKVVSDKTATANSGGKTDVTSAAGTLAARQAAVKQSEQSHQRVTTERVQQQQQATTSSSFKVLSDQLKVLRSINKGIETLVERSNPVVVPPVETKPQAGLSNKTPATIPYQTTQSSINMG